jgi:hypothetical protein
MILSRCSGHRLDGFETNPLAHVARLCADATVLEVLVKVALGAAAVAGLRRCDEHRSAEVGVIAGVT